MSDVTGFLPSPQPIQFSPVLDDEQGKIIQSSFYNPDDQTERGRDHDHPHNGVDLTFDNQQSLGKNVHSPFSGTILSKKLGSGGRSFDPGVIIIKGDNGFVVLLGHVIPKETLKVGDKITEGQIVAVIGQPSAGVQYRPHLHLELAKWDKNFHYDGILANPSPLVNSKTPRDEDNNMIIPENWVDPRIDPIVHMNHIRGYPRRDFYTTAGNKFEKLFNAVQTKLASKIKQKIRVKFTLDMFRAEFSHRIFECFYLSNLSELSDIREDIHFKERCQREFREFFASIENKIKKGFDSFINKEPKNYDLMTYHSLIDFNIRTKDFMKSIFNQTSDAQDISVKMRQRNVGYSTFDEIIEQSIETYVEHFYLVIEDKVSLDYEKFLRDNVDLYFPIINERLLNFAEKYRKEKDFISKLNNKSELIILEEIRPINEFYQKEYRKKISSVKLDDPIFIRNKDTLDVIVNEILSKSINKIWSENSFQRQILILRNKYENKFSDDFFKEGIRMEVVKKITNENYLNLFRSISKNPQDNEYYKEYYNIFMSKYFMGVKSKAEYEEATKKLVSKDGVENFWLGFEEVEQKVLQVQMRKILPSEFKLKPIFDIDKIVKEVVSIKFIGDYRNNKLKTNLQPPDRSVALQGLTEPWETYDYSPKEFLSKETPIIKDDNQALNSLKDEYDFSKIVNQGNPVNLSPHTAEPLDDFDLQRPLDYIPERSQIPLPEPMGSVLPLISPQSDRTPNETADILRLMEEGQGELFDSQLKKISPPFEDNQSQFVQPKPVELRVVVKPQETQPETVERQFNRLSAPMWQPEVPKPLLRMEDIFPPESMRDVVRRGAIPPDGYR
jgi:murein DD-endopeptidase MepM/ murein hydrolase activator NlpD